MSNHLSVGLACTPQYVKDPVHTYEISIVKQIMAKDKFDDTAIR